MTQTEKEQYIRELERQRLEISSEIDELEEKRGEICRAHSKTIERLNRTRWRITMLIFCAIEAIPLTIYFYYFFKWFGKMWVHWSVVFLFAALALLLILKPLADFIVNRNNPEADAAWEAYLQADIELLQKKEELRSQLEELDARLEALR